MLTRIIQLAIVLLALAPCQLRADFCPFCTAVSQTLRQEISQTDVVTLASYDSTESDSVATFQVKKILKGSLVKVGEKVRVNYFGKGQPDQVFLMMGIGPGEVLWSAPLRVNGTVQDYVNQLMTLPTDDAKARLKFFITKLGETDPIIARDVFDEFAGATYPEMVELKEAYDHDQLLKWIQDTSVSTERQKLYLVMLGICAKKEDADILEQILKSDDPNRQAALDAMIACYLTLKGESGLKLIEEKYINNTKLGYKEIYASIMAVRFHGTDAGVIDTKKLAKTLQPLLDRPKLADLVIPDLARWEDWTQIDRIVQLFRDAEKNETTWVRLPAIQYLRACPLPEAAKALEELKELDPATYRRALQFFPQPSAGDSTQLVPRSTAASDISAIESMGLKPGSLYAAISNASSRSRPVAAKEEVNLFSLASVVATFSATLWVGMWLTITGAGRGPRWIHRAFFRSK